MAKQSPRTVNLTYHPGGTVSIPSILLISLYFFTWIRKIADNQGTSPSLVRARKPFRIGNAAIGLALLCFVSGVYTYSIAAVKQDDFVSQPRPSGRQLGQRTGSRASGSSTSDQSKKSGLIYIGLRDEGRTRIKLIPSLTLKTSYHL